MKTVSKRSNDSDMACHASAWDFFSGDGNSASGENGDFRIKQCATNTVASSVITHHEMGHIQYYQQYAHQPLIFRSGASNAFHEAVGDTVSLSVMAWQQGEGYLRKEMNHLMMIALQKIPFLPFALVMEKFRWKLFERHSDTSGRQKGFEFGPVPQKLWDDFRLSIQGLVPPSQRSPKSFDPGAKFHIAHHTPYIRYFYAYLLQFQFYERLCITAKLYDPSDANSKLHRCNFKDKKEVGEAFSRMMEKGSSEPWADTLYDFIGVRQPGTDSLLRFFKPLQVWLENHQKKFGWQVGWSNVSKWKPKGYHKPLHNTEKCGAKNS